MKQKVDNPKFMDRVTKIVNDSNIPVDIDYVAVKSDVSWGTARTILVVLALEAKIDAVRTSKGWIFWGKGKLSKSGLNVERGRLNCQYEVKPMPYRFCEGCLFNGCYPWNINPALLCMNLGGLHPSILVTEGDTAIPRQCASFGAVTDAIWALHLKDRKKEAKLNEETRIQAMDGKVLSNQPLPAELLSLYYRAIKKGAK